MDVGSKDGVTETGRAWDDPGPLTEPSKRRSSGRAKPDNQRTDDKGAKKNLL